MEEDKSKINIHINFRSDTDEALIANIDERAKELHMTRTGLIRFAVLQFLVSQSKEQQQSNTQSN